MYITLQRAAKIAGLSQSTLKNQIHNKRLQAVRLGHNWLTTRRWLHEYLMEASQRDRGRRLPLPADYQAPE
jgi:excisionase family DNA binding protein